MNSSSITTTRGTTRTRRAGLKATIVAALVVLATLVTAGAAQAVPTVSVTGGYTTMGTVNATTYTGRVYDTASDNYCIRVYGKGYNYVRGWGTGNYRGQACGAGTSTGWSESPTVYSDNYAVSLCRGMPNSTRSNCTPYYLSLIHI